MIVKQPKRNAKVKKWKIGVVIIAFIDMDCVMGERSPELRQIHLLAILGKQSRRKTTVKKLNLNIAYSCANRHGWCDGRGQSRIKTNTLSSCQRQAV